MNRAAVYARVSSQRQAAKELPIQGQLDALRAFAHANNYHVVREFIDAGLSGYRHLEKRDALRELIAGAQRHDFSLVLAWKLDRIARSLKDGLEIFGEVMAAGVRIISVCESGIDGSPSGDLCKNLLLSFAEYFSRGHSENVRRGQKAAFDRGGWITPDPPYGYSVERKGGLSLLVPDKLEAPFVRMAFDLVSHGRSLSQAADEMTEAGALTRHGNLWTAAALARIIHERTYLGERHATFGERLHSHRALVTPRAFDLAAQVLSQHRRLAQAPKLPVDAFPLTPYLQCETCGCSYTGWVKSLSHARQAYYVCRTRRRLGPGFCASKRWPRAELEERVEASLSELITPARLMEQSVMQSEGDAGGPSPAVNKLQEAVQELVSNSRPLQSRLSQVEAAIALVKRSTRPPRPYDVKATADRLKLALSRHAWGDLLEKVILHGEELTIVLRVAPASPVTMRQARHA